MGRCAIHMDIESRFRKKKSLDSQTSLDMVTAVPAQLRLLIYYLFALDYIMFAVVCQEDDLLLPDGVN